MPIEPPDLVARLERIEGLLVAALGAEGTGAFERLLVQLSQRKGLSPEERDILNKLRSGYRTYGPYLFRSHYPELFSLPSGFGEEIRETRALAQRTSDTYESLSSTVSRMVQDFESFKETI